jgi:hypothetical protein
MYLVATQLNDQHAAMCPPASHADAVAVLLLLLLLLPQPSDDDLGSKESADIAVVGRWYARIA